MEEYSSVLKTTSVRFTSRASVKIRDSFYTFESTIEKAVPENYDGEIDWGFEKQQLWDECNAEVDGQIEEVVKYLKSK